MVSEWTPEERALGHVHSMLWNDYCDGATLVVFDHDGKTHEIFGRMTTPEGDELYLTEENELITQCGLDHFGTPADMMRLGIEYEIWPVVHYLSVDQ